MSSARYKSLPAEEQARLRAKALSAGVEPCPVCEKGWLQYKIALDSEECVLCDYSDRPNGEPLSREQAIARFSHA